MEKILQYMWQYRLWGKSEYTLHDGRCVRLLNPGCLNSNAGPDFFNAKIFIDNIEWAGNVEIHTKASDWYKHGHDKNPAYDNVILHVVGIDDTKVFRKDGTEIPQITMPLRPEFTEKYINLKEGEQSIRCAEFISQLNELLLHDWLESLACERLQAKATRLLETLNQFSGDWEQTCFITFARTLGFGLNSDTLEILAKSIPLTTLHHHSDSLLQLEALLFGQAGMLDMSTHILDEYYQQLCREYYFLQRKYSLRPIQKHLWKYSKTRPANFPHRRIALLAKFTFGGFSLMRKIIDANGDKAKLYDIFNLQLSGYWTNHSSFDIPIPNAPSCLSKSSINLILINTVAPLYYAYGNYRGELRIEENAIDLLYELPTEKNSILSQWERIGITAENALRSQALLQLRKDYCDLHKCLFCRIGNSLLRTHFNNTITL